MTTHQNPSRKKVAGPLCSFGTHQTPKNTYKPIDMTPSAVQSKRSNFTRLYTPLYRKSNSYKHMHQINKTPSPHQIAENFKQRDHLQEQILKMLEQNSRMIGMLSDFDHNIKKKTEEIEELRALYDEIRHQHKKNMEWGVRKRQEQVQMDSQITFSNLKQAESRDEQQDFSEQIHYESPYMAELKMIKSRLNAIDIKNSVGANVSSFQIRIEDDENPSVNEDQ